MHDATVAVSHYRIVQKLRSGGMGDVYLAEDQVLPRVVALKLLPRERSGDEVTHHRFMREARAASVLSHPNIARIYEAGEADGRVFIAMEYVDGEPLDALIARGPLSTDQIVQIALQLVGAADEAHTRGVIHRDLKPSNVMLTARGEVKVLDFGLAKFTDPDAHADDVTAWKSESGLVMGTVPYMSPEQALGRPADHRSDIFSIGVVLYELVTARLPFAGTTTADTLFRIVNTQPEPMARFNYNLDVELERIIRKCLEKSPDRRYQTAAELLVDLRNFDRDRRLGVDAHANASRMRGLNRNRTAVLSILLLIAVIAGVVLWRRSAQPQAPARSIAVLPFVNRAGTPDELGQGIADLVISDLAQLSPLRVMARSTSFSDRGRETPMAAGKALRVDAVLTGTVDASGERLVVSTELVDVRDGSRIGGVRLERARDDVSTLAALIGKNVAQSLRIDAREAPGAPVNAEAYRLYLRGRQKWNTRTPEGLRSAIDLFRQTIEIEPRFAPAYAGLADTYSLLERYASVPNAESRARAISAAERAVEIEPSLPEAHASLASVRETYSWDWRGAEQEYRNAIRLSPSYATAHHWYAMLLARLGRFDEALQEIALARELDPLSPVVLAASANIRYYQGDYQRSAEDARAALAMKRDFGQARAQLALSLAMSGRQEEALRELAGTQPASPEMAAAAAIIRARAGDVEAPRAFLRAAEARPDAARNGYALAAVHLATGDRAGALRWLRAAADQRSWWLAALAVDPAFASLRGDRELDELLTRIGLPRHAG